MSRWLELELLDLIEDAMNLLAPILAWVILIGYAWLVWLLVYFSLRNC